MIERLPYDERIAIPIYICLLVGMIYATIKFIYDCYKEDHPNVKSSEVK